jgi:mono/diheme cytochrome c family protein
MSRAAVGGALAAALIAAGPVAGWYASAAVEIPATNPLSGDPAAIKEGQAWYRAACSFCHGLRADGSGRWPAADLRLFNKGFRKFVETVKTGRDVPGRAQKMPAWNGALSDDQIYQIGAYLETLAIEGASWSE